MQIQYIQYVCDVIISNVLTGEYALVKRFKQTIATINHGRTANLLYTICPTMELRLFILESKQRNKPSFILYSDTCFVFLRCCRSMNPEARAGIKRAVLEEYRALGPVK